MNKIKFYREELNFNQYELSMATGVVPRWRIQLAERGYIHLKQEEMEAICAVFGKTLPEIFPEVSASANVRKNNSRKRSDSDFVQMQFPFNNETKK